MIVLPSGVINDDDDDKRMEVFFYLKRAFNWARLKVSIMLCMTHAAAQLQKSSIKWSLHCLYEDHISRFHQEKPFGVWNA